MPRIEENWSIGSKNWGMNVMRGIKGSTGGPQRWRAVLEL